MSFSANASYSVLVDHQDLASGDLVATSRLKVDKVVSLHQRLVRKRVAHMSDEVLYRVIRELHGLLPTVQDE